MNFNSHRGKYRKKAKKEKMSLLFPRKRLGFIHYINSYPPPSSATLGGFSSPLVYSSYLRVY
jgi:hypothetical protein